MGTEGFAQDHKNFLPPYEAAMESLSSLITKRKRGDGSKRAEKFDLMTRYLQALELEQQHITDLKIIHIAGTKGKGSTCTFSEAILRECGLQTGLFTSPHLMDVRERYRLNGSDISREKFLMYFWECWYLLKEKTTKGLPMPSLFQFLTLLAFKIFLTEKVDVAIIEVGLGGGLDATNVVEEPVVCGITSLGMDHTEILGDTIDKIASEKAGIFKPQVPAFTVPQLPEAMSVLNDRASELLITLEVAKPLCSNLLKDVRLGLDGHHQFTNAGLAVAVCRCWLQRTGRLNSFPIDNGEVLPEAFLRGLSTAHLSGRAQVVRDDLGNGSGDLVFYLDGAHSPESIEVCARWFSSVARDELCSPIIENGHVEKNDCQRKFINEKNYPNRVLLFNCMEVRDPNMLFPRLINICATNGIHFSKALFIPSMSTYHKVDSGADPVSFDIAQDVSWQSTLQKIWEKIIHGKKNSASESYIGSPCSEVIPSLPLAIKLLRDCVKQSPSARLQVLVTGSLHLVGDVLKLLKR